MPIHFKLKRQTDENAEKSNNHSSNRNRSNTSRFSGGIGGCLSMDGGEWHIELPASSQDPRELARAASRAAREAESMEGNNSVVVPSLDNSEEYPALCTSTNNGRPVTLMNSNIRLKTSGKSLGSMKSSSKAKLSNSSPNIEDFPSLSGNPSSRKSSNSSLKSISSKSAITSVGYEYSNAITSIKPSTSGIFYEDIDSNTNVDMYSKERVPDASDFPVLLNNLDLHDSKNNKPVAGMSGRVGSLVNSTWKTNLKEIGYTDVKQKVSSKQTTSTRNSKNNVKESVEIINTIPGMVKKEMNSSSDYIPSAPSTASTSIIPPPPPGISRNTTNKSNSESAKSISTQSSNDIPIIPVGGGWVSIGGAPKPLLAQELSKKYGVVNDEYNYPTLNDSSTPASKNYNNNTKAGTTKQKPNHISSQLSAIHQSMGLQPRKKPTKSLISVIPTLSKKTG